MIDIWDSLGSFAEHSKVTTKIGKKRAKAGGLIVRAEDTGRVLLMQRAQGSGKESGNWELPGGHVDPTDANALAAATREWEEEIGLPLPEGMVVNSWRDGKYRGYVYAIPHESDVNLSDPKRSPHHDETAAWFDVDSAQDLHLRTELEDSEAWDLVKECFPDLFKGGTGSGNFGHSGRPGEVGGSVGSGYAGLKPGDRVTTGRMAGTVLRITGKRGVGAGVAARVKWDNGAEGKLPHDNSWRRVQDGWDGRNATGKDLVEEVRKNGGFTYKPGHGFATDHWSVAYSGYTEKSPDAAGIDKFIADHADMLKHGDMAVGGWEEKGEFYLDMVKLVPDHEDAVAMGKREDQIGIFHNKSKDYEETGGSGQGPILGTFEKDHDLEKIGTASSGFHGHAGRPGERGGSVGVGHVEEHANHTSADRLTDAQRIAGLAALTKHGMTLDDLKQRAVDALAQSRSVILKGGQYDGMTAYDAGMRWYHDTHDIAELVGAHDGVDVLTTAAAISLTSPAVPWQTSKAGSYMNLITAHNAIEAAGNPDLANMSPEEVGKRPYVMGAGFDHYKADAVELARATIANGGIADPEAVDKFVTGDKRTSFITNILDPDNPDPNGPVTIDRIVSQVLLPDWNQAEREAFVKSPAGYSFLADAVRHSAATNPIGKVAGLQAQAAIWAVHSLQSGRSPRSKK